MFFTILKIFSFQLVKEQSPSSKKKTWTGTKIKELRSKRKSWILMIWKEDYLKEHIQSENVSFIYLKDSTNKYNYPWLRNEYKKKNLELNHSIMNFGIKTNRNTIQYLHRNNKQCLSDYLFGFMHNDWIERLIRSKKHDSSAFKIKKKLFPMIFNEFSRRKKKNPQSFWSIIVCPLSIQSFINFFRSSLE